ncbi:MAG: hypothetical protein WCK33_01245 [Phycisphaerae bacterium]
MPTPNHSNTRPRRVLRAIMTVAGGALASAPALAQLRPDEVLVVYDSRITDTAGARISRDVAEYYAGSRAVPGGAGSLPGARPGVRTLDLASMGAPATSPGNISYADFVTRLQTPLRNHLAATGLTQRVRCLVLTRGLPHRILDTDAGDIMDFPGSISTEFSSSDITAASVDSELTLLWQNLSAGENGGSGDSKADGVVQNPFWRSTTSITLASNANITAAKTLSASGTGPTWITGGAVGSAGRLSAGDLYLVCRLDGSSLADVRGIIDRAAGVYVNLQTATVLLDESESNGVTDTAANAEYDNAGTAFSGMRDADDYEATRDLLINDGRWASANVRYNALTAFNQFFIGPRLSWQANHGIMVTSPVVLVASYGLNHLGQPLTTSGIEGGKVYATSYNYATGAIFNSLESFNCRDFGGLGMLSFAEQQQASAFFTAGGTFAVGNVWEPLADTVPDNRLLAANFLLGTMSFAEAAWSSIPALSWMQVAVGDPLARVQRSSEDIDGNGVVGAGDLYAWEASPVDVNRNGTTDANDRLLVVRAVRAAERTMMLMPR